jgi:hypothetical protein
VPMDFIFWQNVVIPLAGMAIGLFVSLAVIRVVARQLDRRHEARMSATTGGGAAQADALRSELQQLRTHVEALEERVDFAERMLTQERAKRSLEPGR